MRKLTNVTLLSSFLILVTAPDAHAVWRKDVDQEDEWTDRQTKTFFESCAHTPRKEVFKRLKQFEEVYYEEISSIPISALKEFPQDSSFLEVGKVMFPEHLPNGYPMRGAYLVCYDPQSEFKVAIKREDRQLKLRELEDCFGVAYRTQKPETVKKLLACFKSLKD